MSGVVTTQYLLDQTTATIADLRTAARTSLTGLEAIAQGGAITWFDFSATPTAPLLAPQVVELGDVAPISKAKLGAALPFSYTPVLFEKLEEQVMDILTSGGANITPEIQAAIFDQGIERVLQTKIDMLHLAGTVAGSKGCRYANSMVKAQQDEIILNFGWMRSDASRNITQTMGELVQKNLQIAISAGVSIEEALSAIAFKTYETLVAGHRLVLDQFRTESEVAIEILKGDIERASLNLKALVESKTLNIEYQKLEVEEWKTQVMALVEKGRAQIMQAEQANRVKIESLQSLARSYIGIAETMKSQGVSIQTTKTSA
jgi:hypothetical protein